MTFFPFLGSTLILAEQYKETPLHQPSKLLYRNLAITDLCVGIIVEPLAVIFHIRSERKKNYLLF